MSEELQMSIEETIEVVKSLCHNFSHPNIQADIDTALAQLETSAKEPDAVAEDVLFAYYSTLGQIVTKVSIIQAMDQFAAEVESRVATGVTEEDAIRSVMTEAGLPGIVDVAGAVDAHNNI
ncbi:MAG TPA: hypothetical protein VFM18_15220 [Methanosarcina sp.]|nr:hypothetical protein [Methanosarcina sp.]